MRLFDTHAHLLDKRFNKDRKAVIDTLPKSGVVGMIEVGCSIRESVQAATLAEKTDYIYAAVGVHPHEAAETQDDYLAELEALAAQPKVIAVGEIGLDYHYDFSPRDVQQRVFADQLALAKRLDMPVVLHVREATADAMAVLRDYKGIRGVMHCFSGSAETAAECVEMGLCVSFTGVVTFKNARKTIEAVQAVPLESLMAETDCPYMAPEPMRGKRNDPSNVRYVLEKLAEIKNISFEEMCEINIRNAKELYGI